MSRNFYFIGIAFFGMINGIFNQLWLIFALLYVQPFVGPLLFGSLPLTLMFASLMVFHRHRHSWWHSGGD